MNFGQKFKSVNITRGSDVNGQETTYTFDVISFNPVPARSILVIEPPKDIKMTSYVVDCSGKGKISPSLECLYINK
jgi:hypothetical protein